MATKKSNGAPAALAHPATEGPGDVRKPVVDPVSVDLAMRRGFACTAACEMSTLIDVLDREFRGDTDFDHQLWRGVYLRLDTLVSVIISATSQDDRSTEDMAKEIFGSTGWARAMEEGAA